LQVAAYLLPWRVGVHRVAAFVGSVESKQRVVVFGEAIKTNLGVVPPVEDFEGNLAAKVRRSSGVGGNHAVRGIAHPLECTSVEVIGRSEHEDNARTQSTEPAEAAKDILFALVVANAGGFVLRRVGDLVVVSAGGAHETELVVRCSVED